MYFNNAIQKYGWGNFEHIIFSEALSQKEAEKMEILLIAIFETTNSVLGYNISSGGEFAHTGAKHSELTKQLLKQQSLARWENPNYREVTIKAMNDASYKLREYAKNRPQEINKKIGDSRREFLSIKENHPHYGKSLSDEMKQTLINSIIIPVIQLTKTGEFVSEYKSRQEAENETGINSTNISACCNGDRISAGGFLWINKSEYNPEQIYSYEECKKQYYQKLKEKGD